MKTSIYFNYRIIAGKTKITIQLDIMFSFNLCVENNLKLLRLRTEIVEVCEMCTTKTEFRYCIMTFGGLDFLLIFTVRYQMGSLSVNFIY